MPRALVVYESMWGNSERLAQAVADGVAEVMPVDLTDVAVAPTDLADVTLVIAGGPTHGHTMSRPQRAMPWSTGRRTGRSGSACGSGSTSCPTSTSAGWPRSTPG